MNALVKYETGRGHVELREVPEPRCSDGQVKIEVSYCGICGTDLHVYDDTFRNYPPVILGHEFSGRVVEIGGQVNRVACGDRVAVLPASAVTCGSCLYCRMGHFMFCAGRRGMGHGVNGAFARYAVVREDQAFRLPDALSLEEGALCEPLASAVKAVTEVTQVRLGDVALVSGPGPIGLLCLKLLVSEDIRTIVTGTADDALRLDAAKRIGAAAVINVDQEDLIAVVNEETGGAGVDVAFECAGAAPSARQCLLALRPLGRYVQVGIFGRDIIIGLDVICHKQLRVSGSVGYDVATWERSLRILRQGAVRLDDLITHKLPLSGWREAFDLCRSKRAIKVLLSPTTDMGLGRAPTG